MRSGAAAAVAFAVMGRGMEPQLMNPVHHPCWVVARPRLAHSQYQAPRNELDRAAAETWRMATSYPARIGTAARSRGLPIPRTYEQIKQRDVWAVVAGIGLVIAA